MSLGTFGAVLGFAAEMVGRSLNFYRAAVQKVEDSVVKEALEKLMSEGGKILALMEKTRRENVTEMILEPVTGLAREEYEMETAISGREKEADFLKAALGIEKMEEKFFRDASARMPFAEVARIFRKIAQKKEKNLAALEQRAKGMGQEVKN
jgi:hypothetical protein